MTRATIILIFSSVYLCGCTPKHRVILGEGGTIIKEKNAPARDTTSIKKDILSSGDTLVSDYKTGIIYIKRKND